MVGISLDPKKCPRLTLTSHYRLISCSKLRRNSGRNLPCLQKSLIVTDGDRVLTLVPRTNDAYTNETFVLRESKFNEWISSTNHFTSKKRKIYYIIFANLCDFRFLLHGSIDSLLIYSSRLYINPSIGSESSLLYGSILVDILIKSVETY